ncbi:MAG: PAS domain S-box protein [Thermoleophilia bacterium]
MKLSDNDRTGAAQDLSSLILGGDLSEVTISDIPGIVVLVSEAGKPMNCNRLFEADSGHTKADVVTMNAMDYFPPEEILLVKRMIQQALVDGEANVEAHLMTKDGGLFPIYQGR